jgi:hypothetical protein
MDEGKMTDIVARLRACAKLPVDGAVTISVECCQQAADEIERLRKLLGTKERQVNNLRRRFPQNELDEMDYWDNRC